MEYGVLVLVHVLCAFIWGGGVLITGFYFVPSILESGPGGGAVMAGVMKRKYSLIMGVTSILAILTGLRLYAIRFSPAWVATSEGIVLTLGALLGLSAWGIGAFRQRPLAEKLGLLAKEGRHAEIPATAAQLARIARVGAWHIVAVIVLMAGHSLAASL